MQIHEPAGTQLATQEREARTSRQVLYAIAVALFVYGWLSVNIYLPVLPQLEAVFGSTTAATRLTVTIFLLGFSLSELVWGPLSDRFGRRPMLLAGLATSVIGAIAAGFASDIYVFAGARLLESVGLGVAPVLARAVLADTFDRAHIAIAMAYVAIVVATVPAIAPILGGYLDLLLSWRSIFFFVALYGGTLLVLCVLRLPETNLSKDPSITLSGGLREYLEMLANPRYAGFVSIYGIAFGTMVGYYAAAPFIFVRDLGYAAHTYSFLLFFNVACYISGVMVSRLIVPRSGVDLPIRLALATYALASLVFAAFEILSDMDAVGVLLPMGVFIFGAGLVSPAANSGAMTIFRGKAGAATAVVGFAIAMGGAVFSGALAAFHITRLWELGAYVAASTLISFAIYWTLLRKRNEAGGTR